MQPLSHMLSCSIVSRAARALPFLMIFGCSTSTAPGAPPTISTDAGQYVARPSGGSGTYQLYSFRLIATYRNERSDTVFLANCFPNVPTPTYGVVLANGSRSTTVGYNPTYACVGHDQQIAVPPGQSHTDTLIVQGPNMWDGKTGIPFGIMEGRFTLLYQAQTCRGDGMCRLPESFGLSNPFEVTIAAP